jgi:hypothetical protein
MVKVCAVIAPYRRLSGNGGFPGVKKEDIGKEVIVTRRCITWDGVLGHFKEGPDQETHAFHLEELEGLEND